MTSLALPTHIAKFVSGLQLTSIDKLNEMKPAQRVEAASFGLKLELAGKLYAGFALIGLKEEMGHGKFLAALAERTIPARSAARCVALAKLATRVPASNWPTLADLEPSKLELMTNWDDHEIKQFASGKEVRGITLDDAQESSVRDLTARLKDAHASASELQQQLDKEVKARERAEEKARLLSKKQNQPEGFIYPASIEKVRIESSVLASQAITCLDDLEQYMTDILQAHDLDKNKEKQQAQFSAGATALYLNIKSIQAKAAYLLNWFSETIGEDYMPENPEDLPIMSEQEASRIHSMRDVMLIEHRANKIAREQQRKAKRKTRKGS